MLRTFGCALLFVTVACSSNHPAEPARTDADTAVTDAAAPPWWLQDVAKESGIDYRVTFGTNIPERLQGGVCVLDVDGDGKQDLFLPSFVAGGASTSHLYLNKGAMKFADETATRGLADTGHTGACVAFDLDGDGDTDLLMTGYETVKLFRNDGGRFVDISTTLPTHKAKHYLTMPVAFDADGDGDLDIAIADYGELVELKGCAPRCALDPHAYLRGNPLLWLQNADGTFDDKSERLFFDMNGQPGLVLLATDLDADGLPDLFLGNDLGTKDDRYWKNVGGGEFVERARQLGVAHSAGLSGVCSMSALDGDVDVDGNLDLLQSSYDGDTSVIYLCRDGKCVDHSESYELFRSMTNLRWGQALVDLDDDGLPELLEAVGHIEIGDDYALLKPEDRPKLQALEEPVRLSRHTAPMSPFAQQAAEGGLSIATAGRGVAVVDLDGDGAMDVVVGTASGKPLVLHNVRANRGHYLNVQLRGRGKNSAGVGARIVAQFAGKSAAAMIHAGSGYHSSSEPIAHYGLGPSTSVEQLVVQWPSGKRTELKDVRADQRLVITEP